VRPAPGLESMPGAVQLPPDLEKLLFRLVRRVAFGGDGRRGSARIEIGGGELAGATLTIHAERHELRVEIELPPGGRADGWRERIERRLLGRGLDLKEIIVR